LLGRIVTLDIGSARERAFHPAAVIGLLATPPTASTFVAFLDPGVTCFGQWLAPVTRVTAGTISFWIHQSFLINSVAGKGTKCGARRCPCAVQHVPHQRPPMSAVSMLNTRHGHMRPYVIGLGLAAAALGLSALANRYVAKRAERENPAVGRFVEVDGVRLHYLDCGAGEPLVLLHGNGSMVQDFQTSGLIEAASRNYRVIVFDRPGFGHTNRPRQTIWTPEAQAALIHRALRRIGIPHAKVLGHSWGASVALALALKYPEAVSGLILVSGYYYPTVRTDVVLFSGPAVPVVGS